MAFLTNFRTSLYKETYSTETIQLYSKACQVFRPGFQIFFSRLRRPLDIIVELFVRRWRTKSSTIISILLRRLLFSGRCCRPPTDRMSIGYTLRGETAEQEVAAIKTGEPHHNSDNDRQRNIFPDCI